MWFAQRQKFCRQLPWAPTYANWTAAGLRTNCTINSYYFHKEKSPCSYDTVASRAAYASPVEIRGQSKEYIITSNYQADLTHGFYRLRSAEYGSRKEPLNHNAFSHDHPEQHAHGSTHNHEHGQLAGRNNSDSIALGDTPQPRHMHGEYTVAVVCAMSFEMSAIRYMMDEEHERLAQTEGDSNTYIFGKLSGHNTVIGCLPATQGKGAAAVVATNMRRTFPSITCWILIGIGGGVPSLRNDIRLGDVVVSMPNRQYSGVVQYDLGGATEIGFEQYGFLASPPSILRSAVETMRSDHMLRENKANDYISSMIQRGGRLGMFKRPPSHLDVLYRSDGRSRQRAGHHITKAQVVKRLPRLCTAPEYHYGLVASGDKVIKNAVERDAISQRLGDILCFEMEAAGLMTDIPALVIRGIADYSDRHKDYIWQPFAAAAAAACTKELLTYLNPKKA